jgi:hypothetical protein
VKRKFLHLALAAAFAVSASAAFAQTGVVQSINNLFNKAATYSASSSQTLAATPTDVFLLPGSANKTIYVKSVEVSCVKTTAGQSSVSLVKQSTLGSGAAVSVTPVKMDTNDVASDVAMSFFTVNPTSGTDIGVVASGYITFPAPATAGFGSHIHRWFFGDQIDRYLVLRGANENLVLNMGGATLTGAVCSYTVTWMER